jgi:CTP synthase
VAQLTRASSIEFDPESDQAVIAIMEEQKDLKKIGGTMRLGDYPCHLHPNTNVSRVYGNSDVVMERHRHRYEVNNDYLDILTKAGLTIAGVSPDRTLVEIIELKDHPWFVACQFHPEFRSRPGLPHPLFKGLVEAALSVQNKSHPTASMA